MVAGKGLALEHDLVLPVDVGPVEGRHQEVEVGRQGLHHGYFPFGGAHDRGDELGGALVGIEPGRERRPVERLEVALHALRRPRREVLVDAGLGPLGLEAQRVPAEVDALVRGAIVRTGGLCGSYVWGVSSLARVLQLDITTTVLPGTRSCHTWIGQAGTRYLGLGRDVELAARKRKRVVPVECLGSLPRVCDGRSIR